MDKQKICCIIGVNLNKFPAGYKEERNVMDKLKLRLAVEIEEMRRKGVTTFLSGMGRGPELWAAEIILDLKRAYPGQEIRLVAVVPYARQTEHWEDSYRKRYDEVLMAADMVVTMQEKYTARCILHGWRYMIEGSGRMIAVWRGEKSDIQYAVEYAEERGVEVGVIRPKKFTS